MSDFQDKSIIPYKLLMLGPSNRAMSRATTPNTLQHRAKQSKASPNRTSRCHHHSIEAPRPNSIDLPKEGKWLELAK